MERKHLFKCNILSPLSFSINQVRGERSISLSTSCVKVLLFHFSTTRHVYYADYSCGIQFFKTWQFLQPHFLWSFKLYLKNILHQLYQIPSLNYIEPHPLRNHAKTISNARPHYSRIPCSHSCSSDMPRQHLADVASEVMNAMKL